MSLVYDNDPNDQQTFVVAFDGKRDNLIVPFAIQAVSVQNLSALTALLVSDSAGRGFNIAAGGVLVSNFPAQAIFALSAAVENNALAIITLYARPQAANGNGGPMTGAVTITGPVSISGVVPISGNVGFTGPVTIANATLNTQDLLVENNTDVIAGVLPRNVAPLTLGNNATATTTIPKAIAAFALLLNIQDGFLSIFYTASGFANYIVRNWPYPLIALNSGGTYNVEKVYRAPIPAGATLSVQVAQGTLSGAATGVLKW